MVIDNDFTDYQILTAAVTCVKKTNSCEECPLKALDADRCQKEAMRRLCEFIEDRMEQIAELREENKKLHAEIAELKNR